MNFPDLKEFTAAQLRELLKAADVRLKERLSNELSMIVDDVVAKAGESGIALTDIVVEIQRRGGSVPGAIAKQKKPLANKNKAWVNGTTYCNPDEINKTWTAGGAGAPPIWLRKLIPSELSVEEQAKVLIGLVKH